MAVSKL